MEKPSVKEAAPIPFDQVKLLDIGVWDFRFSHGFIVYVAANTMCSIAEKCVVVCSYYKLTKLLYLNII